LILGERRQQWHGPEEATAGVPGQAPAEPNAKRSVDSRGGWQDTSGEVAIVALNTFVPRAEKPEGRRVGAELELEALAVSPAQFTAPLRFDASMVPEKRLMFAVLEEALVDYAKLGGSTRPSARHALAELEAWFVGRGDRWPFSFERICDALDIDPDYLRGGLQAWRTRQRYERADDAGPIRAPVRRLAGQRTRVTAGALGARRGTARVA
jgi:hypothetical protein